MRASLSAGKLSRDRHAGISRCRPNLGSCFTSDLRRPTAEATAAATKTTAATPASETTAAYAVQPAHPDSSTRRQGNHESHKSDDNGRCDRAHHGHEQQAHDPAGYSSSEQAAQDPIKHAADHEKREHQKR